ncbi:MAG: heme-binding protein [Thiomicrorhabdus chilensis]|uniref:GlcG/HbpS family heme-binding protein n=1 Tax=Thiomicrorhabdus chilensis TaxID=63656 RepID=UPI00040E1D18|nr:heme-binding protein [Thiomicrorhabdus chilensis]MDX1347242.1 heme-binding protein [Thiomicrorhabdus chilensis]
MIAKKLKQLVVVLGLSAVVSTPVVAEEPMTVNVARLSVDVTNKIAMGAIESCREKGIPISVTVVDRNGIVQTQMRDTMAPPVSLGISKKKAYTAVMFNVKGSQLGSRADSPLQSMGEGLAFMAGSTPIKAGGKMYGAVGVSGAPDGMDDEACAIAGVETVQMDLEMM